MTDMLAAQQALYTNCPLPLTTCEFHQARTAFQTAACHAKAPPRALRKAQGACEEPRSLRPPSATAAGTRLGPNFCSACMGASLLPDLTRGGLHLTLRITDERTITWTLSLTDLARDGGGSTAPPAGNGLGLRQGLSLARCVEDRRAGRAARRVTHD